MRQIFLLIPFLALPLSAQAGEQLTSAGPSASVEYVPPTVQRINHQAYNLLKPFREKVTYAFNPWVGRPLTDMPAIVRAVAEEEVTEFTINELQALADTKLRLIPVHPNPDEIRAWSVMWQQDISFTEFGYQNEDKFAEIPGVMMALYWDPVQSAHFFRRFTLKSLKVPDAVTATAVLNRDFFVPPEIFAINNDPAAPTIVMVTGTEACFIGMTRHEKGFYQPKHIAFRRLDELQGPPSAISQSADVEPTP